jgi:hypothetical protein
MITTSRLSLDVSATGPDLHLQVILDGQIIWDGYPKAEIETVNHDFDDQTEQEHVLEFHMQGKLPEHTLLDETGRILQDRCIRIENFSFDDIALGHMFVEVTQYHHDHNGTTDLVTDRFYGTMGCNGRVEMRFYTPIYLWLLENM